VRGLLCSFWPNSSPTVAEVKTGIAAKEHKERKETKRLNVNQSAATAKTRVATKIICNRFAFLVSFLRSLRSFAAI
jgi:hypothetical protein